ncbi:hypothetical protein A2466_00560 [Candidatus Falkowbacteria bacterium RIFOXYC2_FULL_34_220]|nr:MAG: hypothetical protein A2466_00560 [Candidatus Falkowbacteria bacterium RIFOXYC2_FULL_34_220]
MKKKLLIVLLMFTSFSLGIIITAFVCSQLNKPLLSLCRKKMLTQEEKNVVLSDYQQIKNPFYKNWYDDIDFFNAENIYVNNITDPNKNYNCFEKEDIDPWRHRIYLESEEGNIYQILCSK